MTQRQSVGKLENQVGTDLGDFDIEGRRFNNKVKELDEVEGEGGTRLKGESGVV